VDVHDVRFPTSDELDGSDAMNPSPDYSAAYVVLRTESADGLAGHALAFTTGPGKELQIRALEVLAGGVGRRKVYDCLCDLGACSEDLVHDPHLRWLGPEKGVVHMAAGAVINAAWDLRAKRAGQPLWQHLARLEPEELVSLVDFRYLTDALTLREAVEILERARTGRAEREERLLTEGYPAYTTTPGWLGYSDDKLDRLTREAVEQGFTMIKLKVGSKVADDVRRMKVARAAVGDGVRIAVDANQRWDVASAIDWMRALAPYDPYRTFSGDAAASIEKWLGSVD
jgi:L-fuconate dehydratase